MDHLATKFAADSTRWYSLSLPRPVDLRIPVKPEPPKVKQVAPGTVQLTLSRATRAKRYRVFVQAAGEAEPHVAVAVNGLLAEVAELPAGIKLQFTVTAANSTGESLPSEPVEFTLN